MDARRFRSLKEMSNDLLVRRKIPKGSYTALKRKFHVGGVRMNIYIKPVEKAQIIGRRLVFLKDIAEVSVDGKEKTELEDIVVFQIPKDKDETYLISVMEMIRAITRQYPQATISNLGEIDILVEYHLKAERKIKSLEYLKVFAICVVLFAGAATTIMCFHSDAQMPLIFQNYYKMFFGETVEKPAIFYVPYSVGLAIGVAVFFNHFSKISVTDDPTPIEVEMSTYEKETNASVVDKLNKTDVKGGKKT